MTVYGLTTALDSLTAILVGKRQVEISTTSRGTKVIKVVDVPR